MNTNYIVNIKSITNSKLSFYGAVHYFERYSDFTMLQKFQSYCSWAKENDIKVCTLENSSNILFTRKNIKSLILVNEVLKYCHKNSLDSFDYLASVPATIGKALSMKADREKNINVQYMILCKLPIVFLIKIAKILHFLQK